MAHAAFGGNFNPWELTGDWASTRTTLTGTATRISVPVPTGASGMRIVVRWSTGVAGSLIPEVIPNNSGTDIVGTCHQMSRGATTNSVRTDAGHWYLGIPAGQAGVFVSVVTVATGKVRYMRTYGYSDASATPGQIYEPFTSWGTFNDTSTAIATLDVIGGTYAVGTFVDYRPLFGAIEEMP